jgi:hypothetical protein
MALIVAASALIQLSASTTDPSGRDAIPLAFTSARISSCVTPPNRQASSSSGSIGRFVSIAIHLRTDG